MSVAPLAGQSVSEPIDEVLYPAEDGEPMAETSIHVNAILLLYAALKEHFQRSEDVFIAADMFWYWEEGNPGARRAPDVMIVPGVGNHDRRSFFSWEEGGRVPAVIFEMASQHTWREDLESKYDLYERLGVREYFVFDPEGIYVRPPLQGFRLTDGRYRRIPTVVGEGLVSDLEFGVRSEGRTLRLIDPRTYLPIPTAVERAELESIRAEQEKTRAEQEKTRAEQERTRAEQEKERADRLEVELNRLRQMLPSDGGKATP